MFDFLKKTPTPEPEPKSVTAPPTSKAAGLPVHLNLAPQSAEAMARSLARMMRLIEQVSKSKLTEEQKALVQEEFDHRQRTLAANGIMVPNDAKGIKRLLREVTSGRTQ